MNCRLLAVLVFYRERECAFFFQLLLVDIVIRFDICSIDQCTIIFSGSKMNGVMTKRKFWSFVLAMILSTYFDLHISRNIVIFALVFLRK